MKKLLLSITVFSMCYFTSTAQTGASTLLGSPQNFLNEIRQQHASSSAHSLVLPTGESVALALDNYYDGASGISMNGIAVNSPNSLFILQGDNKSLYGYLAFHDSKTAFEITTINGAVQMQEISIAKVFPDLYGEDLHPAVQETPAPTADPVYSSMAKRQAIHIGPYNNEDLLKLQSKPGSPYVFYLNNKAVMNGGTPLNGKTKEEMYRVWQCTADQYSAYQLNITMDVDVYNAAKAKDVRKTGIINFVNSDGRSSAPLSSFGTTSAGTLHRNPSTGGYAYGIGMTCAHEVGHQMGMLHDGGGSGGEYFEGLASFQWCPIMGNYWYGQNWGQQLFQWSKGEYNTASNREDDLAIMAAKVPYEVDDNASGKPLTFGAGGAISPVDNWGQIERNTDSDAFTFEIGSNGGSVNLKIDPLEYLRQLDVAAKIVDASGKEVASSNLKVNRSAEFKSLSLQAGKYSLIIEGGAEGTPQNGFSKYSSLGFYGIEGSISGAVVTGIDKQTFEEQVVVYPNPTNGLLTIGYAFYDPKVEVQVVTLTGQILYHSNEYVHQVDISNFANGIYFVKITSQNQSCIKRISKL